MDQIEMLSLAIGICTAIFLIPMPKLRWAKTTPSAFLLKLEARLQPELTGLDWYQYILISASTGAAAVVFCHLILHSWLLSIFFFGIGVIVSERIVMILKQKQRDRFEEGNIRALRVMASSLRTNPSYIQAFQSVVDSPFVSSIVRNEYQQVVKLVRGQVPLELALQQMQARTSSSDISYLYTILVVQRELGGDMAKTLDAAAATILRRKQAQRKQKAALSQLLSQVNLLTVMPFVFITALFLNNPHHFDPLTKTLQGRLLILGAFIAILVGGEAIRHFATRPLNKREEHSK